MKPERDSPVKILDKYLYKELLVFLFIGLVLFTFMFLIGEVMKELADKLVNKGVPLRNVLGLLFYFLPPLLLYTMPMALLFATLITFGKLSYDGEITALKASGISSLRLFKPVFFLGLGLSILCLTMTDSIIPASERKSKSHLLELALDNPYIILKKQVWMDEFEDMKVFIENVDNDRSTLYNITIFIDEGLTHKYIFARRGSLVADKENQQIFLYLYEGSIHQSDSDSPSEYTRTKFDTSSIPLKIDFLKKAQRKLSRKRPQEMSIRELMRSDWKKDDKDARKILLELGQRLSLPFACLTFVLIGAPLSIRPKRASRFYGLGLCFAILFGNYLLWIGAKALGKSGLINPFVASWVPNLIVGGVGLFLLLWSIRKI